MHSRRAASVRAAERARRRRGARAGGGRPAERAPAGAVVGRAPPSAPPGGYGAALCQGVVGRAPRRRRRAHKSVAASHLLLSLGASARPSARHAARRRLRAPSHRTDAHADAGGAARVDAVAEDRERRPRSRQHPTAQLAAARGAHRFLLARYAARRRQLHRGGGEGGRNRSRRSAAGAAAAAVRRAARRATAAARHTRDPEAPLDGANRLAAPPPSAAAISSSSVAGVYNLSSSATP